MQAAIAMPLVAPMTMMMVTILTTVVVWTASPLSQPSLHAAQRWRLMQAMWMTLTATHSVPLGASPDLVTRCVQTHQAALEQGRVRASLLVAAVLVVSSSGASSPVALHCGYPELLLRRISPSLQRRNLSSGPADVATAATTTMTMTMQRRRASLSGSLRCRCRDRARASLGHMLLLLLLRL